MIYSSEKNINSSDYINPIKYSILLLDSLTIESTQLVLTQATQSKVFKPSDQFS